MKPKHLFFIFLILAIPLSGCTIKTSQSANDGGVFITTDFGENWHQKTVLTQNQTVTGTIGNTNTNFMVFDPKDENTIYLVSKGQGIFKTEDRGEHWQATTLSSGNFNSFSIDALNTKVNYTTDGTKILKTVDGMQNWHQIYFENRPGQTIVSVIVDHFNSNIVYAATTTSIIKSFDYGNSWELLDWQQPTIRQLYQSKKNKQVLYALTNLGIYKSIDGALSWIDVNNELIDSGVYKNINNFVFDPATEVIYLGTATGIYRSTNGAASWETIPTLFDFNKISIGAVAYNPNDINEIIFSFNNILHKTEDGGQTWKTIKTVGTTRTINYIIADPYHDDVIFLGTYKPNK